MRGVDFFDTNILVYALSADPLKADRSERLLVGGGVISVQVLNEFVSVATRKFGLSFEEAREALSRFRAACDVVPLDIETHEDGLNIAQRHRLSIYDAMIVAAAQRGGCRSLWSEDLADGAVYAGLVVRNPFRPHR